jgi:tRNA nucleotidyltransferase (CCA-adding enzyme)
LPDSLDFISARTEFYTHPTALPSVQRGSIKLDLHRRDFTINTLALRLDGGHYGELYDYWGGLADLKSKQVKILHSLSFVDDPTRILRAVRYEKRYDFQLDERTKDLLIEAKEILKRVSGDRLRHELDRIFEEENSADMLFRLDELTILGAIHPDLVWDEGIQDIVECLPDKEAPPEWNVEEDSSAMNIEHALCYTCLIMRSKAVDHVCKRLRLSRVLTDIVKQAAYLRGKLAGLYKQKPSEITAELDRIANLAIYAVYLDTNKPKHKGILSRYLSSWQHIEANITGKDLKEAGIPPGPQYADILSKIRAAWLDGEISTKNEEEALLDDLLNQKNNEE